MTDPEQLAERLVTIPPASAGADHVVLLSAPGAEPVVLGPYQNPAVAKEKLAAVRQFVAAAVRAVR